MRVRNHGKYTHMRRLNPHAIARCDYSGFMVAYRTLQYQYQYRGQGLVNTGYKVDPHFLDVPNPQDLTPLIKVDPMPLPQPRPDQIVDNPTVNSLNLDVGGSSDVTLTNAQASNTYFIFIGELTGDVTIFLPGSFNTFQVSNQTTGLFELSLEITNNSASKLLITREIVWNVCNDGFNLYFINVN